MFSGLEALSPWMSVCPTCYVLQNYRIGANSRRKMLGICSLLSRSTRRRGKGLRIFQLPPYGW